MRILIPTADYPPIEGGISTVTVQTARALARRGHEVTVVAPQLPGAAAFDRGEPVEVARFAGYGLGWFRFFPMLAAAWPRLGETDLLLGINIAYGGVIGLLAQGPFYTPYATFGYAYEFLKFPRRSPAAALLRCAYRHSRAVIAISGFTRDNLVQFGVPAPMIRIVRPGAAPVPRQSRAALAALRKRYALGDGPVILAVGRFVPRKGHVTLVEALPAVLERVPEAQLALVGRGPCMYDVLQRAHELGVRDSIVVPGAIPDDDLAGLYQACDVFALPTGQDARGQVEGFGLVFTEAHAHGKPVVAGRSGGVTDAVIDGKTGLIVPPRDPAALAAALLRLLEDEALAHKLGRAGKRRVARELNWDAFADRLLEAAGQGR